MKCEDKIGRFCGNCDSHNSYEYPVKVFCSTRYAQDKDPIVDTLWYCGDYNQVSQECYCVREAMKVKHGKLNDDLLWFYALTYGQLLQENMLSG